MSKTRKYQQFCPVAHSLEAIGEKWSLLIVRDLMRGPQRFTDLLRYLGGITPKWLTVRLRELEARVIVERDSQAGRREVWYRLTPKGRDLAPVVEALAVWGVQHAMGPPPADRPIHPEQTMSAVTIFLNHRGVRLAQPSTWNVRLGGDQAHSLRFDGERWSTEAGEAEADVVLNTTPRAWAEFLVASPDERRGHVDGMQVEGGRNRIDEFLRVFGIQAGALRETS